MQSIEGLTLFRSAYGQVLSEYRRFGRFYQGEIHQTTDFHRVLKHFFEEER